MTILYIVPDIFWSVDLIRDKVENIYVNREIIKKSVSMRFRGRNFSHQDYTFDKKKSEL